MGGMFLQIIITFFAIVGFLTVVHWVLDYIVNKFS